MTEYNYKNFKARYYNFSSFEGPAVGSPAPDFKAYTLDGREVSLSDYFGKPIVIETGSVTCPIYVAEIDEMQKIVAEFPEVQFLVLYVREAHPGEKTRAHDSLEYKLACAKRVTDKCGENRTILVDDITGTAHSLYGKFPDSVYVIDKNGSIAWASQWNRTSELRDNLRRVAAGKPTIPPLYKRLDKPERVRLSVLFEGGWIAIRDFVFNFPALIRHRMFKVFKKKG